MLPPLNALRAFESAARNGSFSSAAQELHVSPSAVSRMVKLLEQRLGVVLFRRLANGLTLTENGAAYLAEIGAAFQRIGQATGRLKAAANPALVIGAGPTLAMRWLIPRLADFQAKHPAIDVRLSTSIAGADPLKPDWTAAIRIGSGDWPGLSARFLFTASLFPVCAPLVAKRLRTPGDLARETILEVSSAPEDWPLWRRAARLAETHEGRVRHFDYAAFALQAAIDGLGVAMARAPFVADDLAAGRLVKPFGPTVPKGSGWYLVNHPVQEANPALSLFRDWLAAVARELPAG